MALEELSFESVNGQTDYGPKVITIAHPEQSSGELKTKNKAMRDIRNRIYGVQMFN